WNFFKRYFAVLWTVAMMILCALTPEQAYSLKITSDNNHYYGARDRSVSLNCEFTLDSEDLENLDIEWNIVPPNRQEDDKLILWYTQSIIQNNLYAPLKNRIYFTSPEPQDGDASLSITDLKLTDSGTYQCKVRYLAREQIKDILLTVIERPDKPVCYMDDEAVLDTNIRLRCRSSQGTPPLKYRWEKLSGNRMLPPDAFVDAPEGDLYLDKITERDSGTYRCTVQNLVGMEDSGTTAEITAGVGMEDCEPVLNVTSPSTEIDGHGPTAGTTAGAIVAVIVLITVTLTPVIYYYRRKRREILRHNAYIWAQRNSCIYRPIRIEQVRKVQLKKSAHLRVFWSFVPTEYYFILCSSLQLRCEEEDNPYERTETTDPVSSCQIFMSLFYD
uniref:Ig-like domain-containing protein n=1 Tax=Dicentrarchus labrax TaxID=13489 RepID=A0A8P4KG69_DICLA